MMKTDSTRNDDGDQEEVDLPPRELTLRRGAAPRPRRANPLGWIIIAAAAAGAAWWAFNRVF